ncbi:protein tramtrack, beta isoform-like isoform X1 [Portunus trituberculatus]|uniref:protein tramtrack, beta isoform-like isoform X1 n=1 Tax=Portunus trituberculatus TaxID=210409 RepID=UPI001E1CF93F|nr:protein tramtrack, beta isoform-like isoform X1 [Portunus trituberculatus]
MADGMLSLSWNNHSTTFTHTLATLREKERYTDVTLSCEGRFYPVHKLVLSTCSEYFMRMFELTPCKHPVVVLQDVQCKEMEALLSYMYAGVVSVAQSDLPQLIKVAEALQIKGLAVPDENLCSNMKFGHTWSPTDGKNSPFPKKIKREENGTQTHRNSDPKPGISPQSVSRPSTQGYNALSTSYSNMMNAHRYSPYSREDVSSGQRGNKKDQIVVPRVTPKLEHKSENRNNKQTNSRSYLRTDYSKSSYRPDRDHTDDHRDLSDEGHDRYFDTDDENSSEMQEVLPVSLVKVEVKDEEDDEHIDVDDTGYDPKHESNQPLPLLVPKREPIEDYRSMSSGSERRSLHYSPWQALREAH